MRMTKKSSLLIAVAVCLLVATGTAAVNGIFNHVTSTTGYQVNGAAGTSGQVLSSDGTNYDTALSLQYQTVQANNSALPQEPILNLVNGTGSTMSCADDSANHRTTCQVAVNSVSNACSSYSSTTASGCTVMADGKWMEWVAGPSEVANFTGQITITLPVVFPTQCFTANFVTDLEGATISHDGQGYNNYLGSCNTTTVTVNMETGADGVGQYSHHVVAFVYGN